MNLFDVLMFGNQLVKRSVLEIQFSVLHSCSSAVRSTPVGGRSPRELGGLWVQALLTPNVQVSRGCSLIV